MKDAITISKDEKLESARKIVITTQADLAVQVGVELSEKSVHANKCFVSSYDKTTKANEFCGLSPEARSTRTGMTMAGQLPGRGHPDQVQINNRRSVNH